MRLRVAEVAWERRVAACRVIQRAGRAYIAQRIAHVLRARRRRELAATTLTNFWRAVLARGRVAAIVRRKRLAAERAGAGGLLTRVARGSLGRRKARDVRHERWRQRCAVDVQRVVRGKASRLKAARRRELVAQAAVEALMEALREVERATASRAIQRM